MLDCLGRGGGGRRVPLPSSAGPVRNDLTILDHTQWIPHGHRRRKKKLAKNRRFFAKSNRPRGISMYNNSVKV